MSKVVPGYREKALDKIIDSASRSIFNYGYQETGMDQIARNIGVTKGTIYLYFNSKEQLLEATCKRNMDLLVESLGKTMTGDFMSGIDKFLEEEMKLPDYVKFHWILALSEMNTNPGIKKILSESYKRFVDVTIKALERMQKEKLISDKFNIDKLARSMIALHNGLLVSILQGLREEDAINIFKEQVRLLLSCLKG